jgi:hypothetical protein
MLTAGKSIKAFGERQIWPQKTHLYVAPKYKNGQKQVIVRNCHTRGAGRHGEDLTRLNRSWKVIYIGI